VDLLNWLSDETRRICSLPSGCAIICGDFNGQLGTLDGTRATTDSSRPTPDLADFVRRNNLTSVFGSPGQPAGTCTSAPICGRAGPGRESDYIFVTAGFDLRRFTATHAMDRELWMLSSHRPLFTTVTLEPLLQ